MIVVSPRSLLGAVREQYRPGRVISLRSPGTDGIPPEDWGGARALDLVFNDIDEDRLGLVSPSPADVEAMLRFASEWDRAAPLLVHCYAGISRSTAAAFIVAAALMPECEEAELAAALRALSPSATPNPYLVRLADARLGRGGRMVAAIQNIGRGAEAFEGEPFALPLRPDDPRRTPDRGGW